MDRSLHFYSVVDTYHNYSSYSLLTVRIHDIINIPLQFSVHLLNTISSLTGFVLPSSSTEDGLIQVSITQVNPLSSLFGP